MQPQHPVFDEALQRGKARREQFGELGYLRLTEDFRGLAKGTVQLAEGWIAGYPHIGRIFRLEQGLRQQFEAPFWAEEKIDGFNVRIFRCGDEVMALTRGGYICPFATDRISELMDLRILEAHPDLVLCAEIAGPENPYTEGGPPFVPEDVRAFVFDMLRIGRAGFLSQAEKRALIDAFGLPAPVTYGQFTAADWRGLREVLLQLDAEGREGVVLKEDSSRNRRVKYVTRFSGIYDVWIRASDMVELPGDFFTGRVLRLALFVDETGMARDDRLKRDLGNAFLERLFESVEKFKRDGRVYHTFRCRFRKRESAERFMEHIRRILGHTYVVQRRLEPSGPHWLLEFDKEVPKLTGLLHQLFGGAAVVD
jgi:putative ATP-dependent DNA ligase